MPRIAVIGGVLAGLAAATALGSSGFEVDIYESRSFLGGRATSWPVGGDDKCRDCGGAARDGQRPGAGRPRPLHGVRPITTRPRSATGCDQRVTSEPWVS